MKTRLIFLVMLIVCISCGTNNKPVSDAQKEKIKGEVKEVVNTFYKGCEEVNFDMIIGLNLNSPDFVMQSNGKFYNYKESADALKSAFSALINQEDTIIDENYAVLDNSTVLYTANSKWLMNFKDGHSILQDPWAMQYLFKKIDNKWKVISMNESGREKIVKSKEPSKELNQVELMKQFLGSWKCDFGNDTTGLWEAKLFGTGIEGYWKYGTKGKILYEMKQLWGYDKKIDKYFEANLGKGEDIEILETWFISNNKYIVIPYSDIANPDNPSFKIEGEFKSPNVFAQTWIINGKPRKPDTYTRIK
jgi:hypothetical protein